MIWLVPALMAALGSVFLVAGVKRLGTGLSWPSAEATVISYEGRGEDGWHVVVQFVTANGRTVQAADTVSTSPRRFRRGRSVTVRYHANDPQRIVVGFGRWYGLIFAIAGLAILGTAAAIGARLS